MNVLVSMYDFVFMVGEYCDIVYCLEWLIELCCELGSQCDILLLLECILLIVCDIMCVDGGMLYCIIDYGDVLCFDIFVNQIFKMYQGGSSGQVVLIFDIVLMFFDGQFNLVVVVVYVVNIWELVNIVDVYQVSGFNFNGMCLFDEKYGYCLKFILIVLMQDYEGELVGVLQLINVIDFDSGVLVFFLEIDQCFIEVLVLQVVMVMINQQLIVCLENLFESLIKLINIGIGEKLLYIGCYCEQVL